MASIVAALVASGCCQRAVSWTRADATKDVFDADYATCERETAPTWAFRAGIAWPDQRETKERERWEACMRARGWIPGEHCRRRGESSDTFDGPRAERPDS